MIRFFLNLLHIEKGADKGNNENNIKLSNPKLLELQMQMTIELPLKLNLKLG